MSASEQVSAPIVVRIYRPWVEKHKAPHGFGSWCPPLPEDRAQQLLDRAIADPDPDSESKKVYFVDEEWCFVGEPTRLETGEYHGYPVPGAEVPERVLRELERLGVIDKATHRRLRKQNALPLQSGEP